MKIMIASDLHGDLEAVRTLLARFEEEGAERLVLLGDILYHGPRNDLPAGYNPKGVIAALNPLKDQILCVRGNCDAEVDQMVLDFPITAEWETMPSGKGLVYFTHGHHYDEAQPMPMGENDVLVHGHTHVAGLTYCRDGQPCLNPGSVSIPKNGTPPSYIIWENGVFSLRRLSDKKEWERLVVC